MMDFPEALREQIHRYAIPVGFMSAKPEPMDEIIAPHNAVFWRNSFAMILAIEVSHSDPKSLRASAKHANEWMLRALRSEERRGVFFDGYLVLCLRELPIESLRPVIHEITVSPDVCRKHVIWPAKSGDWTEHLWSITVLGLPPTDAMVKRSVASPLIPEDAQYALNLYETLGNYDSVAKALEARATNEPYGGGSAT